MPKEHLIEIRPDGSIHFIYDDALAPLLSGGVSTVKRASHVEPMEEAGRVVWYADMSPVGGPTLGPYKLREEALTAEVQWLEVNRFGDYIVKET